METSLVLGRVDTFILIIGEMALSMVALDNLYERQDSR
jgi:hypothetical protein